MIDTKIVSIHNNDTYEHYLVMRVDEAKGSDYLYTKLESIDQHTTDDFEKKLLDAYFKEN